MRFLRKILDDQAKLFAKGEKLERLQPVFNAQDTILFTPGMVTKKDSHVREAIDQKRMMITVVIAMGPAILMALFNTGYQIHTAITHGAAPLANWQTAVFNLFGFAWDPTDILANIIHGAIYFVPIYAVVMAVGGFWEVLFAVVRRHEVTEGFLVTGMLIPLIVPATIPLWQLVVATTFGVVIGKEIFGGVGMNVLNPALVARAFLFFAYPAQISGDQVWIAADFAGVDGLSGATVLAKTAESGMAALQNVSFFDAFIGLIPGSLGETSTLACLLGAGLLLVTGIGSWRTMFGIVIGTIVMATFLNAVGSDTNPMFALPFHWHMVLGGWAFGAVFMATDPVSSAFTARGKLIYGFFIGVLVVLVRVVNPAYPEGMMLAILFMNMFAPFIDHWFVQANIKRRANRYAS